MLHVLTFLRFAVITVSIALIPAWPDLMGHATSLAAQADAPLVNAHYLLLVGMFAGSLLLVVAPRLISDHLRAATLASGLLGSAFLAAFALGTPPVVACATVATGVTVISLYGSTFYTLAETAGFREISFVSAGALALKALLLPLLGTALPPIASQAAICAVPAASALLAVTYGVLCRRLPVTTGDEASVMKSYGRRTSVFMAILICVSSAVFAVARASSNLQFWGSCNPIEPLGAVAALSCTLIFVVICYATFTCAPRDLMLRFMPCLVVQLIAYGLLWCGALPDLGVTGPLGYSLFSTYTELYSHMYFFMVMFVGLSMLGTAGVRVHGAQWAVFSAALFAVLALGMTEPTPARFVVVLALNAVLAGIFLVAHKVYAQDQVEAIKAVSEHGPSTSGGDGAETPSTLPQAIDNIARRYGLSEREHEVLELLVQGRSRAYIGERLSLASGTVGTYVSRIYEKVRVHSKQELLTIVYDEVATER